MTYEELSKFTWAELSNFTHGQLSKDKLELLSSISKGEINIPEDVADYYQPHYNKPIFYF